MVEIEKRREYSEQKLSEVKRTILIFPNGGQAIQRDVAPWGVDDFGRPVDLITFEPLDSFKHYYRIDRKDYHPGFGFLVFRCPTMYIYELGKSDVFRIKLVGIDYLTRKPMLLDTIHQLLQAQLVSAYSKSHALDSENIKLRKENIRLSRETYGPTQIAASVSAELQKMLVPWLLRGKGPVGTNE